MKEELLNDQQLDLSEILQDGSLEIDSNINIDNMIKPQSDEMTSQETRLIAYFCNNCGKKYMTGTR